MPATAGALLIKVLLYHAIAETSNIIDSFCKNLYLIKSRDCLEDTPFQQFVYFSKVQLELERKKERKNE
jgi:hypothetical protein